MHHKMYYYGMDAKRDFGKRLRFVREMREMTQAQLAQATCIDQAVISHFEAGRRSPSLESLKALAKAVMVSSDYLLGLSERIGP
jgi:transcriptional regulator with XRE-family HTH domain